MHQVCVPKHGDGFVNSLVILIFLAQMPELVGANWQTFALGHHTDWPRVRASVEWIERSLF